MKGRQIFGSQEPTAQIDQIFTKYQLEKLDNVFTKKMNTTFERYTFLTQNSSVENHVLRMPANFP